MRPDTVAVIWMPVSQVQSHRGIIFRTFNW